MRFLRKWGSPGFETGVKAAVLAFLVLAPSLVFAEPARRSLELELDDVPGSTGYEIRVTRVLKDNSKKAPVLFKITGNQWSAKLLPGHYTMEVRSFDSRHVPGAWSPPQEFTVKLPLAEQVQPAAGGQVKSDDSKQEKVKFEWNAVEGAEKYKLRIMNPDGSVAQETIETGISAKVKLPVAQQYSWTVTPFMEGDIEGDVANPAPKFDLVGAKIDAPKILPVDDINTVEFNWGSPEFANKYEFVLETLEQNGDWKPYDNKSLTGNRFVERNALPTGRYRLKMVAHANLREDSDAAKMEFKTLYVNTRSPAAIEQIKSEMSYDTKTVVFGLASYYVTFVNYTGANNDSSVHSDTTFSAIGGTGRLGVGTWFKEDSKIGLMTTADLSGYTIHNETSTYYAQTLQGVYRQRIGALGQLRFNFGAQYRDLPVTVPMTSGSVGSGTSSTNNTYQSKISTLGPLLGVSLAHGFTRKIGAQVNLQVMDSMAGTYTPNGRNNVGALSYQLGLLGSLNLGPNLVGFMGYAYRDEKAAYAVNQGSSLTTANRVEVSGHYINLLLEYGF